MVDPFLNGTTQITVIQKKPVYNKNTLNNHLRFTAPLKSLHAAQNGFKNHSKFQFRVREKYNQMKEEECVFMKSQYGGVCTILCSIFWIDTTYV